MPKSNDKHQSKNADDRFADREAERYENPIPSREYIIEILTEEGPLSEQQLLRRLALKGQERRHALGKRLSAMQRDSQILCNRAGEFGVIDKMDLIAGVVEAHRDGFGFLLRDDDEDIYLAAPQMRQLIHGDSAVVRVTGENRRGQLEGRVVEVVNRNTERIVGRLARQADEYYIVPDNPRITHDFLVNKNEVGQAKIGDYVIALITRQPKFRQRPHAVVVERLGEPMAPGLEIDVAIHRYDLPHQFSEACLEQANQLGSEPSAQDRKGRHDLRELPLVTIDGEDARDFDDAVYCEPLDTGGYRLVVAIADVAHYVGVGSELDTEAHRRGTSVYFPGRVVPMLPEAISNGLCSINPDVDRLCMVCDMQITRSGELDQYVFYEAVMHSHARLTYSEVAEVLEMPRADGPVQAREELVDRLSPVLKPLQNLYRLFGLLNSVRGKRGAIEFETVETQIVFDEQRKIQEIVPTHRNDAHRLIEECMLCANVAAARFLEHHKLAALYRVHQGPKPEKLDVLRAYLSQLGLVLTGGEKPRPADFRALMLEIDGRADASLIQIMLLRSMSQAVYQPDNDGHFGLAYDAYAHFTSPIRRYPDLLVHRAIKQVIRSRRKSDQVARVKGAGAMSKAEIAPYSEEDVVVLGMHCSMTERRADDATRDVVAWLKCEYLETRLGSSFNGVITAVTGFGFFVELENLYAEGLVHVSALGQDYFHYDKVSQALVGERTRRIFRMGDSVRVIINAVDLDQRRVELELDSGGHLSRDDSALPKKNQKNKRVDGDRDSSTEKRSKKKRGKRGQGKSGKQSGKKSSASRGRKKRPGKTTGGERK